MMKKVLKIIPVLLSGYLLAACSFSSRTFPTDPVNDDSVTSIEVVTNPTQTSYYDGDYFDPAGMVVQATWSSGKVEGNVVNNRKFRYDDTPLTVDKTNIEISYYGATAYVPITVTLDTLLTLEIKEYPTRLVYFTEGDEIDTTGLILYATYQSGRNKDISSGYTVNTTSITPSTTAINISYQDKQVNIPITVIEGSDHLFEAETFIINGGSKVYKCTTESQKETYAHPSNDAFIEMKNTSGSGFSFIFNSDKNTIARFVFRMLGNTNSFIFGNSHNISLNTDNIVSNTNIASNVGAWNEYVIFTTNVYEGTNRLSVLNSGGATANIDRINVYTDGNIEIPDSAIIAGTSAYSIDSWNELFPNQVAEATTVGDDKYLNITLLEGKKTLITASDGQSDLDGMLDFSAFKKVTIQGSGTFEVKYSQLCDGINAYNLTVASGVTLNLIGSTKEDMSGIKIYEDLVIDGIFNLQGFAYAQAITKDQSSQIRIFVNEGGEYNISDVNYGIYAWSSVVTYPYIEVEGSLNISSTQDAIYLAKASDFVIENEGSVNITSTSGYGIYNSSGSIILRDSSNLNIRSGKSAIYAFRNLLIANGDDNETQNNASLILLSDDNIIQTSATNAKLVFNTSGEVLIKSSQNKNKTGIQFSHKSALGLTIKAANFTIENANNAIGSWVSLTNASGFTTYDYSSINTNKITIKNCNGIYNSGYNNATAFGVFTDATVIRA